ncbi:ANTAR domain-containing protein [Friedmanniella luteola]|uniref:ANTAR domain-containing protein n=1 Tax=Friedmanniella luteola TaxID=546871 RepID=A0A1H1U6W1_9ACTN|nr:GAF and ANTAR domain-containing protein [Friedmanniella luteola]SDS67986.1 ANTAR domain-containing protein [Friedmanniella luteola]
MHDAPVTPAAPQAGPLRPATPLRVLAELGPMLQVEDRASLTRVLQRVTAAAWSVVPELTEVSVTLIEDGSPATAAFAGSLASYLDQRQYEEAFGPCLDAAVTGSTIAVDTADPASPYPEFRRVAAGVGITQVVAVGLPIAHRTAGALNLYSASLRPLSPASHALAETFAGFAAVAVANASRHASAAEEAAHMRSAIRAHSVIEQARGILMATGGTTAEEAIAQLAQESRRQHRAIWDVASEVVDRVRAQPRVRAQSQV